MVVDTGLISSILKSPLRSDRFDKVIDKAALGRGLELEEAAVLLRTKDKSGLERIYRAASELKRKVFGRRVVLFAPLYLTNYCTNGCTYCGFRSSNKDFERKALDVDEAVEGARALEAMGFKRILLVCGEDPSRGAEYISEVIRAIYAKSGIRVVHVNAAPMDAGELKLLKKAGACVYQLFQETYHKESYAAVHPFGPKSDYSYRLGAIDRALCAGFEDVGIGSLLGLYEMEFDVLATIAHSAHLYRAFGTHAHTISVPRLRPAEGTTPTAAGLSRFKVTDEDFKRAVAVYRLSVPTAGVVVTTRESAALRSELLDTGASQFSAASRTEPGGYTADASTLKQFSTSDKRSLIEVMGSIVEKGFIPSLCSTCYRTGRVGDDFTETAASGKMKKFCEANSILTLKEYMLDHEPNGERKPFEEALRSALAEIDDPALKEALLEKLRELEHGARDLYF